MHYVFKSTATADLIVMKAQAEQILKLIGREPAPQGILPVAAMPAAIAALEAAVAAAKRRPEAKGDAAQADDADGEQEDEEIDLGRRAWPFVEMLKRASAEGADVVWGV